MRTTTLKENHEKAINALELLQKADLRKREQITKLRKITNNMYKDWTQYRYVLKQARKYARCERWLRDYYRRKLESINRLAIYNR